MEIIGWIGATAFTFCAVPQAYKSFKDGHSDGLSLYYLLLWLIGEIFTIIYVVPQGKLPLTMNYIGNLIVLIVILKYKFYPRKRKHAKDEDVLETEYLEKHVSSSDDFWNR
jgi:uncharacterized protein with PQ loop repeat